MIKTASARARKRPSLEERPGLSDADLDHVAGGLNPQPLPPRWSFSLVRLHSVLPAVQLPSFFRF